jgi:membrane protein DedA with SNARE-associated domain
VSGLLDSLLNLHGLVVYLIVAAVVFAEDALFVGFVVPGETAAVLGGVAASRGNVSLPVLIVVVVVAAVVGDSVGYEIGARYGTRLLSVRVVRRQQGRIDTARELLARRGGPAVFLGRFVAYLCAVMPFLAGFSGLPYRRFLAYNAAGGVAWGTGVGPARLPRRPFLRGDREDVWPRHRADRHGADPHRPGGLARPAASRAPRPLTSLVPLASGAKSQ